MNSVSFNFSSGTDRNLVREAGFIRAVRTRGHFPNDAETDQTSIQWIDFRLKALKLLYLVLNHSIDDWKQPPREWCDGQGASSP